MCSAYSEHQQCRTIRDELRVRLQPFSIGGQLIFGHRAIAKACGGRALKSPVSERHVGHTRVQRSSSLGQRGLCRLHIWKEFFVSEEMPDPSVFAVFDGQHAQQAKAALKLKDQIIACIECLCHVSWKLL
jgi:hypothetical protein